MTREGMIHFLKNHRRYNTMNSWNNATNYAVKIKIHSFPMSNADRDACYEALDYDNVYDESGFNGVLREFDRHYKHLFQIGINGRSGGYAVLYQGGQRPDEHKRKCHDCGQRNFDPKAKVCGRCHSKNMHDYNGIQTFSYPGRGMDIPNDTDFEEWDDNALRDRVRLVQHFDRTVKKACQAFIEFARSHKIEEETIMVPKKVKVAVER